MNINIEQKLLDCCRWVRYQNVENLPESVCISCFEYLEQSWQFCEDVAATQLHLREMFSDCKPELQQPMNPNRLSVDVELNLKDQSQDDDDHSLEEVLFI